MEYYFSRPGQLWYTTSLKELCLFIRDKYTIHSQCGIRGFGSFISSDTNEWIRIIKNDVSTIEGQILVTANSLHTISINLIDKIELLEQDLQLVCVKRYYYSFNRSMPFADLIFSKPIIPFRFIDETDIETQQSINWQEEGF